MRLERANGTKEKGWYLGPWNSGLGISVGYANVGIDSPHVHQRVTELYLVDTGRASVRVERRTVALHAGDVLVIEAGEAHTFLSSSEDYLYVVLHVPALAPDEAQADRIEVPRSRLEEIGHPNSLA